MDSDATMTGLMALMIGIFIISAGRVILRPFKGQARDGRMRAGVGSPDQNEISHPGDAMQERLIQGPTLAIVPSLLGPDASETYAKHHDSVPAAAMAEGAFAQAEPGAIQSGRNQS